MEMESVVWHIIIHKQPMLLRDAITNKRNQMSVMNTGDDFNYSFELSFSLASTDLQLFNRNFSPVGKNAFVNTAKASFAEEILLGEAVSNLS